MLWSNGIEENNTFKDKNENNKEGTTGEITETTMTEEIDQEIIVCKDDHHSLKDKIKIIEVITHNQGVN